MELIFEFFVKMGIIGIEFLGVIILALFIQLVVYQLSHKKVNLYKIISYNLLDKYIK